MLEREELNKITEGIIGAAGIAPIHVAQILSYLKLSGCKVGLLINFNVKLVKNGIKRFINGSLD
ncbi:MAG TPA: GxxExxY protein [Anaerolineales bacterium]|nr:GxxExxY protein [Anaerolineales bacterium]